MTVITFPLNIFLKKLLRPTSRTEITKMMTEKNTATLSAESELIVVTHPVKILLYTLHFEVKIRSNMIENLNSSVTCEDY